MLTKKNRSRFLQTNLDFDLFQIFYTSLNVDLMIYHILDERIILVDCFVVP